MPCKLGLLRRDHIFDDTGNSVGKTVGYVGKKSPIKGNDAVGFPIIAEITVPLCHCFLH